MQLTPWKEADELKDQIQTGLDNLDKSAAAPAKPAPVLPAAKKDAAEKPVPTAKAINNKSTVGPGGRPLTLAEVAAQQATSDAAKSQNPAFSDNGNTVNDTAIGKPLEITPPKVLGDIVFPMGKQNTRFAAFWRAPYFWFVYADPQAAKDPIDVRTNKPANLGAKRKLNKPNYVAYTFKLPIQVAIQQQQIDAAGVHYLIVEQAPPALPNINWQWQAGGEVNKEPSIIFPVRDPGPVLSITDPVVGDNLMVVPASASAAGPATNVLERPEFSVLPMLHGLAVQMRDPAVQINSDKKGVLLFKGNKSLQKDQQATADQAVSDQLFAIDKWAAVVGDQTPDAFRLQRDLELVDLQGVDRLNYMRDTARSLFALNRPYEANGWLNILMQEFPQAIEAPEIRLLRGAVHTAMQRGDDAEADLNMKGYASDPEVSLWRMWAAVENQDWPNAKTFLQNAGAALYQMPAPYDVPMLFAALKTAYAYQDIIAGENLLKNLAARENLSADNADELAYWQAQFAVLLKDDTGAHKYWEQAANGHNPKAAARATLAQTKYDLASKKIDEDTAIKTLDSLRYRWRGDEIERQTLDALADLYLQTRNFRPAFETWEMLIKYFPQSDESKKAAQLLVDQFNTLFGAQPASDKGATAAKLSPIEALALYRDFQKYQPNGPAQQAIAQNLAMRLQEVGLGDEAASLLKEQIHDNTTLADRKVLAMQLARAYLIDNQPDAALESLSAIQAADWTVAEKLEVDLLRARVGFAKKDYAKVYELIGLRDDENALRLLADTAWREQSWPRVVTVLDKMIGPPPTADQPLEDEKAKLLVREAIALTLTQNTAGLNTLQQKFGAAMGQTGYAPSFRLLTRPPAEGVSASNLTTIQANLGEVDMFTQVLKQKAAAAPPTK